MRGSEPTLSELFVDEQPDIIDLYCYEALEEFYALLEEESAQVVPQDTYDIVSVTNACGICGHPIGVFVRTTHEALRILQQLLFDELSFVCVQCSTEHVPEHYNG